MNYLDEFRNKALVQKTSAKIHALSKKKITLMEVCGGHTMIIQKTGIPGLLPETITLISGPGCPVCVTDHKYIDTAIAYARQKDVLIATFGDLIRVPGSTSSLNAEKAKGADVKVVYSSLDALHLARQHPEKKIIFLAIGFETTAPGTAVAIREAQRHQLDNFLVLSAHKLMPPAMSAIVREGVRINGYIAPGHVSTITGADIYRFIPEQYHLPVVVSGFEPLDILQSILLLVKQAEKGEAKVEIQYQRVVSPKGNVKAQNIVNEVFEPEDSWWRGLGILPESGLKIKPAYKTHDALVQLPISVPETKEPRGCICGEILKGLKKPSDCRLFGTLCTPVSPVGACMVSNEGACQALFRYRMRGD